MIKRRDLPEAQSKNLWSRQMPGADGEPDAEGLVTQPFPVGHRKAEQVTAGPLHAAGSGEDSVRGHRSETEEALSPPVTWHLV